MISDPKIPGVTTFAWKVPLEKAHFRKEIAILDPPSLIWKFLDFDLRFIISDPKNPWVTIFTWKISFEKDHFRNKSAILRLISRFVISNPGNPKSTNLYWNSMRRPNAPLKGLKTSPPYWIWKLLAFDFRFKISDPQNPWVTTFT